MRFVSSEPPPAEAEAPLKEWLSRLVVNTNAALNSIIDPDIRDINYADSASLVTQSIPALGTPVQISFGPGDETLEAKIHADGTVDIRSQGVYAFDAVIAISNGPLNSRTDYFIYYELNGDIKASTTFSLGVDTITSVRSFDSIRVERTSTIKAFIVATSLEAIQSEIHYTDSGLVGVPPAPSARITIRKER